MSKGYECAVFRPDAEYTRHSEGAFLRLRDGSILFAYSRFACSAADDAPSSIAGCLSRDEGKSWSDARLLIDPALFGAGNAMSVSLLRMANGDLGLFYIVKQTPGRNRIMLSRSRDEAQSFYEHIDCTAGIAQGYYVLNNDRIARLESGRLIMPLAYHRGMQDSASGAMIDGRGAGVWLYSDDDGFHWQEAADEVFAPFTATHTGLQEPGVIEKKNGALWGYYRTDQMTQYESYSFDGGLHWTPAQPSRFSSPASPMKIARHPSGRLYALWNPIPNYVGREVTRAGWGRTPLALAFSDDDGAVWSKPQVVEEEEGHGYCYPAMFFTDDGCLLAAYCSGGDEEGNCLARLTIRRIDLAE